VISASELQVSRWKIRRTAAGLHFFDRSSGLNVLIDEARVPTSLSDRAPRQVSVALTDICDLRCAHCYAPKSRHSLGFDDVAAWLTDLDTNGCLGVGFGGGEPTLYPRFAELCRFAVEETQLAITVTTHAHHIDGELARDLAGNVHFVRVSMDGVGKTYERLRGRPFSALLERLRAIRTFSKFGINFVVNADTVTDLDAAVDIAADLGASEFLLLPQQKTSSAPGIDDAATTTLHKWVAAYRGAIPLLVSQMAAEGIPHCLPVPNENALEAYAHVDSRGVLKPTSFDAHGVQIGRDGIISALTRLRQTVQENIA
jgi:sulfatase maturation enzyme AslB (radical SAM superfamily)